MNQMDPFERKLSEGFLLNRKKYPDENSLIGVSI